MHMLCCCIRLCQATNRGLQLPPLLPARPLLATIDGEPAAPLASEQEVTAEIPVGERSQAKLEAPRQMDSEIHKRRQHHKLYNYRYSGGRFQAYWGPSVW
jgi:hypothetical protein